MPALLTPPNLTEAADWSQSWTSWKTPECKCHYEMCYLKILKYFDFVVTSSSEFPILVPTCSNLALAFIPNGMKALLATCFCLRAPHPFVQRVPRLQHDVSTSTTRPCCSVSSNFNAHRIHVWYIYVPTFG